MSAESTLQYETKDETIARLTQERDTARAYAARWKCLAKYLYYQQWRTKPPVELKRSN